MYFIIFKIPERKKNEPTPAGFELTDKKMTLHPSDTLSDIKIMKNKMYNTIIALSVC